MPTEAQRAKIKAIALEFLDALLDALPEDAGTPGQFAPPRDLSDVRAWLKEATDGLFSGSNLVAGFDRRFGAEMRAWRSYSGGS